VTPPNVTAVWKLLEIDCCTECYGSALLINKLKKTFRLRVITVRLLTQEVVFEVVNSYHRRQSGK